MSFLSRCFYSQNRLRTKSECSEELVWSLPDSSVAFNKVSRDTFSHIPAGDIIIALSLRKTFSQNSPWSETVPLTQLTPAFKRRSPHFQTAILSVKMLSAQQKSLHCFILALSNQRSHLNWFPLALLFIAILDKSIMVRAGSFLPISHRRACVSYNPSGKISTEKDTSTPPP